MHFWISLLNRYTHLLLECPELRQFSPKTWTKWIQKEATQVRTADLLLHYMDIYQPLKLVFVWFFENLIFCFPLLVAYNAIQTVKTSLRKRDWIKKQNTLSHLFKPIKFEWNPTQVRIADLFLFVRGTKSGILLTSLLVGITNCTASSFSLSDGKRGLGSTGLGAVWFLSRPKWVF